jgi:hypothetical protein
VDVCHSVKVGIALSFALMQKKQKSRKIHQRADRLRSLRAFFLASARQKPLINICLCSGCADLLYQVCRGGFYRGVYNGIRWDAGIF